MGPDVASFGTALVGLQGNVASEAAGAAIKEFIDVDAGPRAVSIAADSLQPARGISGGIDVENLDQTSLPKPGGPSRGRG